jgi:hypothetical protein
MIMINIKTFEGYFNKSDDVLFEPVSQGQLEKFTSTRNSEEIYYEELSRISIIFRLKFKLNADKKTAHTPAFSMDLVGVQKKYPRVFAKFSDDWWVLIMYNYETRRNIRIICDGIDGIKEYVESVNN